MLLIVFLTSLLLEIGLFSREAAATITWTAPPPQRGPLQQSDTSIRRTTQRLLNGSTEVQLKWNFILSGVTLDRVSWEIDDVPIGRKTSSGIIVIEPSSNFREHFNISASDPATLIINKVTEADEAVFKCNVESTVKTWADEIEVKIDAPPIFTNVSRDHSVNESTNLQLFCEASGKPPPNITWTRDGREGEVLNHEPTLNIPNISSTEAGTYRCTADNGVGNRVRHTINVKVFFAPRITLQGNYNVDREQAASLHCQVKGYPPPAITWTPCSSQWVCNNSFLNISKVQTSAEYTCTAENSLGKTSATTNLVIGGNEVYFRMTITSENCTEEKFDESFWKKLKEAVNRLFENMNGHIETSLLKVSFPVVYLSVKFTSVVTEDSVLSVIGNATQGGTLKEFCVNASSIVGTAPITQTTTKPPVSRTTPKPDGNKTAIIVGAVVGSLAVVAIIVAVVIWYVHKKKKQQGKGTKEVGDDQAAGQGKSGAPASAAPGLNNSGYFDAGSASGYANASGLPPAKPPSKKQNKQEKGKKQKETNEQQALPLYAQVDKSKKTPKPPLNTYDQVERSRKSQPGEVMYTQVEQVNPGGSMPRAAASPVRRPPAYDDTQYAELII